MECDTMASFFNFEFFLSYSTSSLSFYAFGQSFSETDIQFMMLLVNHFIFNFVMILS